jgi:hypothetical protein
LNINRNDLFGITICETAEERAEELPLTAGRPGWCRLSQLMTLSATDQFIHPGYDRFLCWILRPRFLASKARSSPDRIGSD